MTLSRSSRSFIAAGQIHLTAWGVLWTLNVLVDGHLATWDTLLWLFAIGFVGFTILGFSLHLFPFLSGKPLHVKPPYWPTLALGEAAVVLGSIGLSGWTWAWVLGMTCWLLVVVIVASTFLLDTSRQLKIRVVESETTWLFAISWVFGVVAAGLWESTALDPALMESPGLGLWVVSLHIYLLGQVSLLIFGVSCRMIPKALTATPPTWLVRSLPYFTVPGAILVPASMAFSHVTGLWVIAVAAIPMGVAAILFLAFISYLTVTAATPKPAAPLYLASALSLVVGGSMGAFIAYYGEFPEVGAHALVALFGFVTVMVIGMSFSMLAPFQFVAHRLTILVMRLELVLFVAAAGIALVAYGLQVGSLTDSGLAIGAIVTTGAALLLVGSFPVVYYDWWNARRPKEK